MTESDYVQIKVEDGDDYYALFFRFEIDLPAALIEKIDGTVLTVPASSIRFIRSRKEWAKVADMWRNWGDEDE